MELNKPKNISDWIKIYRLYKSAFPRYERKPFLLICRMFRKGSADVWVIEDNGGFSGLAVTMNSDNLILLDYFAVHGSRRGLGIGSKALKLLQDKYGNSRLFLEIESTFTDCANKPERIRRKAFYLKNGMSELKIAVNLFGTEMELLGYNCSLDYDEYYSLYTSNLGEWIKDKISQLNYPGQ